MRMKVPEYSPANFFLRYDIVVERTSNAGYSSVMPILDFVYQTLDEHLLAGRFELVGRILVEAAEGQHRVLDPRIAVGFLTITLDWADELPGRAELVAATERLLFSLHHDRKRVDEILKGLR